MRDFIEVSIILILTVFFIILFRPILKISQYQIDDYNFRIQGEKK